MDSAVLQFDINAKVGVVTINRPHKRNAIDEEVLKGLEQVIEQLNAKDNKVRSIVITGAGTTAFCAGGDLDYFSRSASHKAGLDISLRMTKVLKRFWEGPQVVVAAINGSAHGGGCEILTACHKRVASSDATFTFVQSQKGLITGWGGGVRLFRQVGERQALRLLLTADELSAEQALQIGLIDKVVPKEDVICVARESAEKIAGNVEGSIKSFFTLAKEIRSPKVMEREMELFLDCWDSQEFQDAMKKRRK